MGLQEQVCRITQGWKLSRRSQCIRGDDLEDVGLGVILPTDSR